MLEKALERAAAATARQRREHTHMTSKVGGLVKSYPKSRQEKERVHDSNPAGFVVGIS